MHMFMLSYIAVIEDTSHAPTVPTPWDVEVLPDMDYILKMDDGVIGAYRNEQDMLNHKPIHDDLITFKEYITDLMYMLQLVTNGPLKSFCYRRLCYLSSKFQVYIFTSIAFPQPLKTQPNHFPHLTILPSFTSC